MPRRRPFWFVCGIAYRTIRPNGWTWQRVVEGALGIAEQEGVYLGRGEVDRQVQTHTQCPTLNETVARISLSSHSAFICVNNVFVFLRKTHYFAGILYIYEQV